MAYTINDRRASALGGQSKDRSRSTITTIVWHYSAVTRSVRKFITGHEEYWKTRSVGIVAAITFTSTWTGISGRTMTTSESLGESTITTGTACTLAWRPETAMITHKRKLMHAIG